MWQKAQVELFKQRGRHSEMINMNYLKHYVDSKLCFKGK
ncbi:Hypothetical protein BN2458_PEG0260 [Helicobacter typhlonius]|uniref:Uncharacterized protein n=1 Tax=Helicobacter typhlonius TaxID=76936 RepID=A0A0S4PS93_9HELI|nr:Hypothetical protein BN2458_PEG0260 [Helicobacter typhlonius]